MSRKHLAGDANPPSATASTPSRRPAAVYLNPEARPVARAILSTLDAAGAVFALATLATFARTLIDVAALLRQCSGAAAEATASAMIDGAESAFDGRFEGVDPSTRTFALTAVWWFASPLDTVANFWRDDMARENVESQARAALADIEDLRAELAPDVVRAPLPAGVDRIDLRGTSYRPPRRARRRYPRAARQRLADRAA